MIHFDLTGMKACLVFLCLLAATFALSVSSKDILLLKSMSKNDQRLELMSKTQYDNVFTIQ